MRVEWDFSRLPESEHARVIELMEAGKWWALVEIHNKYALSDSNYCCSNTLKGLKNWYKHGVETGQIKAHGESGPEVEAAPEV